MKKPHPIIALAGPAGCGKDTVADYLSQRYNFTKLAFADALRIEVAQAFGVPVDLLLDREHKELPVKALALSRCNDHRFGGVVLAMEINEDESTCEVVKAHMNQPRSPRRIMQLWGTEYRRRIFGDEYWITEWEQQAAEIAGPIVVPDCREDFEAEFISRERGEIWQIHKPDVAPVAEHSSEIPVARCWIDRDIDNSQDLEYLHKQVEHALRGFEMVRRGVA